MTEENVHLPGNTFTLNATPAHTTWSDMREVTYNPNATGTVTWPPYTTWPSSYTTGYLYAQLSEQQLGDLEERFRKVMRSELKFLLSQVLDALEDEDSEDNEDEEA